jgi:ferredoxin
VSGGLPQTGRVMVKDEDVCVHCGLCAERCPTAAWDMARLELILPKAGPPGDGAGSAPAKAVAGGAGNPPRVPAAR